MQNFTHLTVLKDELVLGLNLKSGDLAIDCTVGGGGHTEAMLNAVKPGGRIFGLDRDQVALDAAGARLKQALDDGLLVFVKEAFSNISKVAKTHDLAGKIQGVAADIGVSSPQLDHAERGFSFDKDGPLDMRMDQKGGGMSAADFVNQAEPEELARIFFAYGEEPKAKILARLIAQRRAKEPFQTTKDLADFVSANLFYKKASRKHPATKIFQALRIHVNNELGELEALLEDGFSLLKSGGRLGVITFHSLEDRIVKQTFNRLSGKGADQEIPRDLPLTPDQLKHFSKARGSIIKPFPILPSTKEQELNPRSRSAKLRIIEKF